MLGSKIQFLGSTDFDGNPHIEIPMCLWTGELSVPEQRNSELPCTGFVPKTEWASPVRLPYSIKPGELVVERDVYFEDECFYQEPSKLNYGLYKCPQDPIYYWTIKVRKITRSFWATSFGIYPSLEAAIAEFYRRHPNTRSQWVMEGETKIKCWAKLSLHVFRGEIRDRDDGVPIKTVVKLLKKNQSILIKR